MTRSVFTYGTLMFAEVMREVSGIRVAGEPVQLSGFRRFTVRLPGRTRGLFPAIVPEPGAEVRGVLYRNVTPRQLARMDAFEEVESGRYVRERCRVESRRGPAEAWVYVCGASQRTLLDGDWRPEEFQRNELAWYIANVVNPFRTEVGNGKVDEN